MEYLNDGIPSYSEIKNILSRLKNMVWLSMCHHNKKIYEKTRNGQKTARKLYGVDFFMGSSLIEDVESLQPKPLGDLKANIERKIKKISKNILNSNF